MASDRREMLEFNCAAIAQAEACGFDGTAAALRETMKWLCHESDRRMDALPSPDAAIEIAELGPVLQRCLSKS